MFDFVHFEQLGEDWSHYRLPRSIRGNGCLARILNIDAYLDTRPLALDTAVARLGMATSGWHWERERRLLLF